MKKILRICSICLIIATMLGTPAFAAQPQPDGLQSNSYIFKTTVSPVALTNGVIEFDCAVTATGRMDMVGIERIEIRKAAGGALVESHYYTDPGYEYLMGYNTFKHSVGIPFQGVTGQSYYAVVIFYASKGNGSGGVSMESFLVTAK